MVRLPRLRKFLLGLALCLGVVGADIQYSRPAHAQLNGYCMAMGTWTSKEPIFRGGHTYTPKYDSAGDSTVCLGGDGLIYVLTFKDGVATDLHLLSMSPLPIDN